MCDKVKIQNNGDWVCPKCEAQNSEHKDNIKIINKVLCNSCYDEFELDKDESQKHNIEIQTIGYSKAVNIIINGEESYTLLDSSDDAYEMASCIKGVLEDLGIESELVNK